MRVNHSTKKVRKLLSKYDFNLVILVLFTCAFGVIMVFSASSYRAEYYYNDSAFYFKRQGLFFIVGTVLMVLTSLIDYKVFCFDGTPKIIQVDFDRFSDHKRNFYTPDWEFVDETVAYPNDRDADISRPQVLDRMLEAAAVLSQGFQQVRVDFYAFGERLVFGEMTFSHGAGYLKYDSEEFERKMGDRWNLCDRINS